MFLETPRLILRKFREEDFPDYWAYANDEEMNRMMGQYPLDTEKAARDCFGWLKDREERGYCLVDKAGGHVIGNLTVTNVREELAALESLAGKRGVSLSFCISRQYRRQGLMTEAVGAVIAHLFRQEGMDYVQCGYFDYNAASRAFQERLGFTLLTTSTFPWQGEQITTVEQVLWRRDWENSGNNFGKTVDKTGKRV